MTLHRQIDYDALDASLSDPSHLARSTAQIQTARPDDEAGRVWLRQQFGSDDAIAAAIELPRGRPRGASDHRGASPTVRARLSSTDFEAFNRLAEATGRSQSDLVRGAIHQMLLEHKLVS